MHMNTNSTRIAATALGIALATSVAAPTLAQAQNYDLSGRHVAIYNLVGDVTTYRLDQVRVNLPVKASDFAFAPPVDYKVADHRPYRGGGRAK